MAKLRNDKVTGTVIEKTHTKPQEKPEIESSTQGDISLINKPLKLEENRRTLDPSFAEVEYSVFNIIDRSTNSKISQRVILKKQHK